MKKIISRSFVATVATCFMFGLATTASAQTQDQPKSNYINIGYNFQSLGVAGEDVKGLDWGASLEFGKTFFAHKEPILELMWLGVDWTYADLLYGTKTEDIGLLSATGHVAQIGMQVGPSLTVALFDALYLKANVRYAPTYSVFASAVDQDWDVYSGYAGYVTTGISASFKFITAGFEYRFNAGVPEFKPDAKDGPLGTLYGDNKLKFEMPSARLYVGFRF